MKLQLNNSGAWKNVLVFKTADEQEVMGLAHNLVRLGQPGTTLRILGEHDVVWRYWDDARGWYTRPAHPSHVQVL